MRSCLFLFFLSFQLMSSLLRGDTVVIIHGFMSNAESMRKIRKVLTYIDFCVYVWEYPSKKKFLQEHGYDLVATLNQMAATSPGETIHFVTHSSGALVLRVALNHPNCPQEAKVGRAVLIAPPNRGSVFARRFRGFGPIEHAVGKKSGRQLMYLEPYQFDCFGQFPCTMDVLVIAGTRGNQIFFKTQNDNLLTVEETYLNTPFYFKAIKASHGDLLSHREALRCMRAFITIPEPGHPDSDIMKLSNFDYFDLTESIEIPVDLEIPADPM